MTSITSEVVKTVLPINTIKVVFNTILVVLFLLMLGAVFYFYHRVDKLETSNTDLTAANQKLSRDLELVKSGRDAIAVGQLFAGTQKDELTKKAQSVSTNLKIKEQAIDRSQLTAEEKDQQKSTARMDSVWTMYCQVQPTNTICLQGGYK